MKLIILLFVSFFCHSRNVQCEALLHLVKSSFGEIERALTTAFNKVKLFFNPLPHVSAIGRTVEQYILEEKIKQAFNDFVEKTAADTENNFDNPEYANMRSEPTALMSTPQLAALHGRRIESHVIKTSDGYLLTLHRILKHQNGMNSSSEVVLLNHGLLGSSADWILLGEKKSLPYVLCNAGYDVWMINARGNYYSRGHVSYPVNSFKFWKFSWQEMGMHDLPAVIDYIRKLRNSTKGINYIGHSMGATSLLVLLSTNPRYNQFLRMGILLAPLAFMNNVQGPIKILTSMAHNPPPQLLNVIGDTEFMPSRKIPKIMSTKFCNGPQIFCCNPLLFFTGGLPEEDKLNKSFLARLLYHAPAGGSTNTILHYGQLVESGKFHKFSQESAEFPLQQVTLPIVFFSSDYDWLASVPDVLRLYFSVANPLDHYVVHGENLSHTEFVWGANANEVVFPKIIDYLANGLSEGKEKVNEV